MTTGKNEFSLVVRASAGKSRPVRCSIASDERVQREIIRADLSLERSSALGKKEKNRRWPKKKKIGEQSEPRGSLGSFPHPQAIAGLASLADTFPI